MERSVLINGTGRFAVERWKRAEKGDCLLSLLEGAGCRGQGSQMKQIKGEPWPPGETLAGHKDGIQMGSMGGLYRGSGTSFFFLILIR